MSHKNELLKQAILAQKNAHAPYSGKHIGAAVIMQDGAIFNGCNVENASYGGTICAERTAIFKAISEGAKSPIKEILVVSDAVDPWPPCGFCRQVIAEFADKNTLIHTANNSGLIKTYKFEEILPMAFMPDHLDK